MNTTNAERVKRYRRKMQAHGFKRLSSFVCPEILYILEKERKPYECYGRVLERLLLGESKKRPKATYTKS